MPGDAARAPRAGAGAVRGRVATSWKAAAMGTGDGDEGKLFNCFNGSGLDTTSRTKESKCFK